jgi:MoaA/NifB/PqqE/SkfB family radical SAM enzyme
VERLAASTLSALPRPVRSSIVAGVARVRSILLNQRPYPRWITLFITNACQARCEHCFYWQDLNSGVNELDISDYERIFTSMPWKMRTIRIGGGEPFIRKDLEEFYLLIDRMRKAQKVSISTNGMFEIIKPLDRMLGFSRNKTTMNVSISLDGLEKTHDRFRRVPGGFKKCIHNLRVMLDMQREHSTLEVSVCTTITRANIPELPDLISFLRDEVGVRNIGFDFIRSTTTDLFHIDPSIVSDFTPPSEQLLKGSEQAVEFLGTTPVMTSSEEFSIEERRAIIRDLELQLDRTPANRMTLNRLKIATDILDQQRRLLPCIAGNGDCVIYPSGDVAVCEYTTPFANLKEFGLDFPTLWNSVYANRMRQKTRQCACTHPCHLSDSMSYHGPSLVNILD